MAKRTWYKETGAPSREHVIPEARACPDGFVLSDGTACGACNDSLGHADQAVIDDFDIPAYMNVVPRKRGRPPQVRNRGNMIATTGRRGKEISINMERHPVNRHDGNRLAVHGRAHTSIRAFFERDGSLCKVYFSV